VKPRFPNSPCHRWDVKPAEALELQRQLAGLVRLEPFRLEEGMRVAGVDVSYRRFGKLFHGAVAVLEYPGLNVVDEAVATRESPFPYVPGLLSFRELPVLVEAFAALKRLPDLVLVDGQGIAHPRRFGLASHLGVLIDLPSIGCAKSCLSGEYEEPGGRRGDMSPLLAADGELGRVVRTRDGVKPLFISPGHRCDVASAAAAVLACHAGYRLPEPTRQAHLLANRQRLAQEGGG